MILGQLDIHMQKNDLRSLTHITYKYNEWTLIGS